MENLTTQLGELFAAIQRSDVQQVKKLVSANISPNQPNADGKTALMVASRLGNPEIIRLLWAAAATSPRPAQIFFEAGVATPDAPSHRAFSDLAGYSERSPLAETTPVAYSAILYQPQPQPPLTDYISLVNGLCQALPPQREAALAPAANPEDALSISLATLPSASTEAPVKQFTPELSPEFKIDAAKSYPAKSHGLSEIAALAGRRLKAIARRKDSVSQLPPKQPTTTPTILRLSDIDQLPDYSEEKPLIEQPYAGRDRRSPIEALGEIILPKREVKLPEYSGELPEISAWTLPEPLDEADPPLSAPDLLPVQTASLLSPTLSSALSTDGNAAAEVDEDLQLIEAIVRGAALREAAISERQVPTPRRTKRRALSIPQTVIVPQNAADGSDRTPSLKAAVLSGDLIAVEALLKAGADFRPAFWYETPVLVIAAEQGHTEIMQALIAAGANVNSGYDRLPLHIAAERGHLAAVQVLLNSGAYIHGQEEDGGTALMAAAAAGHLAVVQLLVAKGAHVNATSQKGETPITLAAQNGHQAVYQFLYPRSLT